MKTKLKKDPRGRKTVTDPIIQVSLNLKKSVVEQLGGKPAVQEIAYKAIEREMNAAFTV
ncbi:MAG: hypothetical protein H7Y07_08040 [Pyrinomonadaceae bacterium]|nr:hypothetical protein [Sphingobacteriaceae bacterium]